MDNDIFLEAPVIPTHYRISDGRIWDIDAARFVDAAPDDAVICELYANGKPGDAAYLKRTLASRNKVVGYELLSLGEAKAAKLSEINAVCDAALAALTADYPESELLTFDKQEAEARALVSDQATSTPLLTALAEARGIGTTELALRVIAKADAFTTASGHIIGLRQKDEDRLKVAQSVEDVAAIVPEYRLPEAG